MNEADHCKNYLGSVRRPTTPPEETQSPPSPIQGGALLWALPISTSVCIFDIWHAKTCVKKKLDKNEMHVNWHAQLIIRRVVWLVKKKPHVNWHVRNWNGHGTLRWHLREKCTCHLTFIFVFDDFTWHLGFEVEHQNINLQVVQYMCDFIHVLIFVTVSKFQKNPKLTNIVCGDYYDYGN